MTGDLTGSKAKIAYLGWTVKPWGDFWQHPIFALHGAGYFLREVILKYWRGGVGVARNSDAVGDHGWVLFDFDVLADN